MAKLLDLGAAIIATDLDYSYMFGEPILLAVFTELLH